MHSANPSPDTSFVVSRTIGEATVTVVSDGRFLWAPRFPVPAAEWRRAEPDADTAGRAWFGLNVVLVRIGAALVVVDPAFDAPGSRFERQFAKAVGLELVRSPGLDAALALLDLSPAGVTHVAITHPHGDHIGGLTTERNGALEPRFPNARHFLGRADWVDDPVASEFDRPLAEVERHGLLDLVDGEREIVPGVKLIPTPGETPGHQVVRLESGGAAAWMLGDLVHHPSEVEHPGWAPPHVDANQVRATRMFLFPILARSSVLVIPAHAPFPGWNRVVKVRAGYRLHPA